MHNHKSYAHAFKILHNCKIVFCFLEMFSSKQVLPMMSDSFDGDTSASIEDDFVCMVVIPFAAYFVTLFILILIGARARVRSTTFLRTSTLVALVWWVYFSTGVYCLTCKITDPTGVPTWIWLGFCMIGWSVYFCVQRTVGNHEYLKDLGDTRHGQTLEQYLVRLKAQRPVIKFSFKAYHSETTGSSSITIVTKRINKVSSRSTNFGEGWGQHEI